MKKTKNIKNDIILISVLLALTALIFMLFRFFSGEGSTVVITVSGKAYAEYPLSVDAEYLIEGKSGGVNKLVISNGSASITEANCPDKLCVNMGKINTTVKSIVCLPNEVSVSIKSSSEDNNIDAVVG